MLLYLFHGGASRSVGGIYEVQIVLPEKFPMKLSQNRPDRNVSRGLGPHSNRIDPGPFHKRQYQ
jgi:hypothetical protein